jgi:hypothetical protein
MSMNMSEAPFDIKRTSACIDLDGHMSLGVSIRLSFGPVKSNENTATAVSPGSPLKRAHTRHLGQEHQARPRIDRVHSVDRGTSVSLLVPINVLAQDEERATHERIIGAATGLHGSPSRRSSSVQERLAEAERIISALDPGRVRSLVVGDY